MLNDRAAKYYLICIQCDAKTYSDSVVISCPRCGRTLTAKTTEKIVPPWVMYARQKRKDAE